MAKNGAVVAIRSTINVVPDRSNLTKNSELNAFACELQTYQELEIHKMNSRYKLEFIL